MLDLKNKHMQTTDLLDSTENKTFTTIEEGFLGKVMQPYRANTTYLKSAEFIQEEKGLQGLTMQGTFGISGSCYIDDTGHFNAVEYNICYNQIGYVYLGHCIREKLIPELSKYSIECFFEKQLSNILIVKISSSYKKPIDPRRFYGTYGVKSINVKSTCVFLETYCNFYDDGIGKSQGEVLLAILHP